MTKVPSLPYDQIIRALQRDGWVVVRQKGSHVHLQKRTAAEALKLTIPSATEAFHAFAYPEASEVGC